jgi:hypothetical protein
MSGLRSLKFCPIPRTSVAPTAACGSKVIERLMEQRLLVEQGPQTRTVQRWTKKGGERVAVEKQVKVHPWRRTDDDPDVQEPEGRRAVVALRHARLLRQLYRKAGVRGVRWGRPGER